ncbi:MAG: hypothetical protein JNL46_01305 [Sphingosinicella sp.]|nr:hypothetical protein [Sphingosinicella sp.]
MGPSLVFDKSFLQSLSVDEAVMLDQMFTCVVTPVFMVETLADLAKEAGPERPAAKAVAGLAERTPVAHGYMNTFHQHVAESDLLGDRAAMDHRPAVAGGIPVRVDGKAGVVFEKSPEAQAFERWQAGAFLDVERLFASQWRKELGELDLKAVADGYRSIIRKEDRPKNHAEARRLAAAIVDAPGQTFRALRMSHDLLDLPAETMRRIATAWKAAGSPPFRAYAPFAAHCLEVDLYFVLAMTNGIISDQRSSNRIDVSYLCYLPFAHAFVSQDRLHRSAAPLFMSNRQRFVWGPDLKADLKRLNEHFSGLPDEERSKGLFLLAANPPRDDEGLCATLWDLVNPGWRKPRPDVPALTREQQDTIIGQSKGMRAAALAGPMVRLPRRAEDVQHLSIARFIPKTRGSWRMFSAETEAASDEERRLEHEARQRAAADLQG